MLKIKVALFYGTFDPINNGQLDIIKNSIKIFDKLIVLVIENIKKPTMFSAETRLRFIKTATLNHENVEIDYWPNLLSEYVKMSRADVIIRGINTNFSIAKESEFKIENETSNNLTQTIFMLPNPRNIYISSELVRKLCILKKNLNLVVPKVVEQEIKKEV